MNGLNITNKSDQLNLTHKQYFTHIKEPKKYTLKINFSLKATVSDKITFICFQRFFSPSGSEYDKWNEGYDLAQKHIMNEHFFLKQQQQQQQHQI